MPHPDPDGVYLDEWNGRTSIQAEIWEHGNRRNRIARMMRIARNLRFNNWRCQGCGEEIPLYRRADARYCTEQCRKAAARMRRATLR